MTLMQLRLDQLRPDLANVRRETAAGDLQSLIESMRTLGQLQPIVVRFAADSDGWRVVAGGRRVAAARALGLDCVSALALPNADDDTLARAASLAENMVRTPMHPVDQWCALAALIDSGLTLQGAADAVGLTLRVAQRLALLGRMAPELLAAMRRSPELPDSRALRCIATASHADQIKALRAQRRHAAGDAVAWYDVAQELARQRIPQSRAIFPIEGSGVTFEEDLFAEPGSDEQFTTTDVAGFMRAQRRALDTEIAASERMQIAAPGAYGSVVLPKGWSETYEAIPKRWKKSDPRKVFACIVPDGARAGTVERVLAAPDVVPLRRRRSEAMGEAMGDVEPPRPTYSKAALGHLAAVKRAAVGAQLRLLAESGDCAYAVRLLALCFGARNVSVRTAAAVYQPARLESLLRPLLCRDGRMAALGNAAVTALVAALIERVIAFDHPKALVSSGPAAEWVGAALGADVMLPRCDTAEIINGILDRNALVEIARAHAINTGGTMADIRKRMIGNMPAWRPVWFGAPAPDDPLWVDDADDEAAAPAADDAADVAAEAAE